MILGDTTAVIQDGTAGIPVRFAADDVPAHERGSLIDVVGVLAAPYGNLELRAGVGQAQVVGTAAEPDPSLVMLSQVGESMEGWLVRSSGTILSIDDSTSGSVTLTISRRLRPESRLLPPAPGPLALRLP